MDYIIRLVILIFSVVVHEVSHGVVAEKFGDDTARREGRITLNPIPHIDPFASVLLPLFLSYLGGPVLGAAKPVPVDFGNMRRPRLGMAVVSLAGPLANFALAVVAALILKFGLVSSVAHPIMLQLVGINVMLGTFNLIPIPPLDGSKVLASLGNHKWMESVLSLERFGFILILLFLMLGILDRLLFPVLKLFFTVFGLS